MSDEIVELRTIGRQAVRGGLPPDAWTRNQTLVQQVINSILGHPCYNHPIIACLDAGRFTARAVKVLLLEYHYALARDFTTRLLRTMELADQLKARVGAGSMCAARFLLQLNLLDELGFHLGTSSSEGPWGDPANAHYVTLLGTMEQVGISEGDLASYQPSDAADRLSKTWAAAADDFTHLASLMATAETLSQRFFPSFSRQVGATLGSEDLGYFDAHAEDTGDGMLEELHAQDLWLVVALSIDPSRSERAQAMVSRFLDDIENFADALVRLAGPTDSGPA